MLSEVDIKDVVIIGAGPAGIATAIQLKHYNIEPILLEQAEIGGLLRNANFLENYPGFPDGIGGLELVQLFKKHLKNFSIKVNFERVLELEYCDNLFLTKTNCRVIKSSVVVIATGTKPKKISVLPISDNIKDRIFYEIYPILGIKNKKIAIIGAGDVAFDYGLNLSQNNEVIILNRRKEAKCIPVLMERCMKSKNISYFHNVSVSEINNADSKTMLTLIHSDSQTVNKKWKSQNFLEDNQIYTDYVVIAIGREPCIDFLGSNLKKHLDNLLNTDKLYLVGDIKNEIYRQTAICVGDGIKAAMKIYRNIERERT